MTPGEMISGFGYWVRRRRLALDLTQSALATCVGCAAVTLRKIEADERRPSLQMAERLADCLDISQAEKKAFLESARGERSADRLPPAAEVVSLPHSPGNLPAPVTSLIGRRAELEVIGHRLADDDVRLLTLTGPGGVGKTRLALAAARDAASAFPDGVWLVPLASVADALLAPASIAGALGVSERSGQAVESTLSEYLAARRMLLVLDNCEHLPEAYPLFASLLSSAPGLKLLATSRAPLQLYGEHVVPIEPFPLPSSGAPVEANDAVRLFMARALATRHGLILNAGDERLVVEICCRLDGLPLALELAAAQVRRYGISQLAAALDLPLAVLIEGPRDAPPRQRSLRDALAWSYNLLPAEARRLFERLSVFRGGFIEEAAEAMMGGLSDDQPERDAAGLLARLTADSLISKREGRFSLLETVRQYGAERLAEHGQTTDARRRHLAYFRTLAEEAAQELWGPDQARWMARLIAEQDNLRVAMAWAFEAAPREGVEDTMDTAAPTAADRAAGVALASALYLYWNLRGQVSEGRRWMADALLCSNAEMQEWAAALVASGSLAWQQGDYDEAERYLSEGLAAWRGTGYIPGLAEATHLLGHLVFDRRDFLRAGDLFMESQALYGKIGDETRALPLGGDLGLVACQLGDYPTARHHYEAWRADSERLGVMDSFASSLVRLGELDRLEGDYALAQERYERALVIYRDLKEEVEEAGVLCRLGRLARRGDSGHAADLLRQSLRMQQRYGNHQGVIEALTGLAGVWRDQEESERAATLLGAAAALLAVLGAPISPPDLAQWEQDEAGLRALLGPQRWTAAYTAGAALNEAAAIALALSV